MIISGIDVNPVFERILLIEQLRSHGGEYYWCTWFSGYDNSVTDVMPPGTTELRARAIMKMLGKAGYIDGCHCGCRGDYELTEKGLEYALTI